MAKEETKPKLVPTARKVSVSLETLTGETDALTKFATLATLEVGDVRVHYGKGRVTIEKGEERRYDAWGQVPNPDFQRASFDVAPDSFEGDD